LIEADKLKELIIRIAAEKNPESIRELIYLVRKQVDVPEKDLFFMIQDLKEDKRINLWELMFPETFREYLFSSRALWYWVVVATTLFGYFFILMIPYGALYRGFGTAVLGILYTVLIPGFSVLKTLFPIDVPLKTSSVTLDSIERLALSIGLSLAVTPLVGIALYYSIGLNLVTISVVLLMLSMFLSTYGVLREFQARRELFIKRIQAVTGYELENNILKFFIETGLLKKNRLFVNKIPIASITQVNLRHRELSLTWNGTTSIFLMQSSDDAIELQQKLQSK
jgi:hypothetical protein